MNDSLFDNTKLAAYFLWEHSGCDNALNLWYCAEEMACFFEQEEILDEKRVSGILQAGVNSAEYVWFVRHVAYRVYIYTNRTDDLANWYMAERLLYIGEWVRAITGMASIYRVEKNNHDFMNEVRSENVRGYYDEQTFKQP